MKTIKLLAVAFFATTSSITLAQTLNVPGGSTGTSTNSNTGNTTTTPSHPLSIGMSNATVAPWASGLFYKGIAVGHTNESSAIVLSNQGAGYPVKGIAAYNYGTSQYLDLYVGWGGKNINLAYDAGNVGIGTNNPTNKLHVNGSSRFHFDSDKNIGISGWELAGPGSMTIMTYNDANTTNLPLSFSASKFYFDDGNVGIGTTNTTGFKLSVAGKMRAEEIEVSLSSGWADYVFADNYELSSLAEVEKYITENNHLPNVPSAKEVEEKGINLGEMDAILLRKIEELTLYIIELEKKISKDKN